MKENELMTDVQVDALSDEELCKYYSKLSLLEKDQNSTENKNKDIKTRYSTFGMKVREKLNIVIRKLLKKILKYDVDIEGYSEAFDYPVIFASSHQDNMDMVNSVFTIPKHFLYLNSSAIKPYLKAVIELNGCVYVDRGSSESRKSSKEELINYLKKGYSINMYPEGAYNLSPNKLHMPYHIGVIDIAKKSGRPIVPFVQEYEYEYGKNNKLYIKKVHVKFGKMIHVSKDDNLKDKLAEYDEAMSTLTWELYEKINRENNGERVLTREEIKEQYYKDFLSYKEEEVSKAGSSIEKETKTLYGNNDEFYKYFPINAVNLDEQNKHIR